MESGPDTSEDPCLNAEVDQISFDGALCGSTEIDVDSESSKVNSDIFESTNTITRIDSEEEGASDNKSEENPPKNIENPNIEKFGNLQSSESSVKSGQSTANTKVGADGPCPDAGSSSGGDCSGGEVRFKKLKLSHRKYRERSQEDNRGSGDQEMTDESARLNTSNDSREERSSPAADDSSDDSDEVINLVDELSSSSSSTEEEESNTLAGALIRRAFRFDINSTDSDQDENDEENLEERHRQQLDEEEEKIVADANKILEKPRPVSQFNVHKEFHHFQRGGVEAHKFRKKLYGSISLVERFELDCKLEGHEGCVNSLHFNNSGSLLASGSDDLKINVWDWEKRSKVTSFLTGHRENVFQSKFLPGDLLITSCSRDGQVRLAQLCPDGSLRVTSKLAQHRGPAHKMSLVQDEYVVLSAGEDGQVISVDTREQKSDKILLLKNDKDKKVPIYSIQSNPVNSNQFCTSGRESYIRIFDRRYIGNPVNGEIVKYSPKHLRDSDNLQAYITCAVFNYNGTEVLGSYNDEDIYLFQTRQQAEEDYYKQYRGHRNDATVKGVNFYGQYSEYIVSGSDCGNIFFWSKETEALVHVVHGDDDGVVNVLEPHPTLPVLATSGLDYQVKIFTPSLELHDDDGEEEAREKLKRNFILKTVKKNLRDRSQKVDDVHPMYGNLLYELWRNMRRRSQQRRRAAAENGEEPPNEDEDDSEMDSSDEDGDDDFPFRFHWASS